MRAGTRVWGAAVAAVAAVVLAGSVPAGAGPAADTAGSPSGTVHAAAVAGPRVTWSGAVQPLQPARILDTRSGNGAAARVVGPGETLVLQVAGRGGVPPVGAGAVALNLTTTASTGPAYLTVWPTGAERPLASSLNVVPGRSVANSVTAKLGRGGTISIYNSGSTTHVIADVNGWYPEGGGVEPLVPARLLDTRDGSPAGSPLGPSTTRRLQVAGRGGVPSTGVSAVVLNVTVTAPTAGSYLTVWPSDATRPGTSNLNFVPGQTVPNAVISKVAPDGTVSIFNSAGSTHVVVDVTGWFPDPGGIRPVVPARLVDTRIGLGAPRAAVGHAGSVSFGATGRGGVPATGVSAVVLNVTATEATAGSYLTVWPAGSSRPTASSVNFERGQTVPNLVVAKVGDGGRVSVYNGAGTVQVVVDVVGWFPDASAAATTTIQPWDDTLVVGSGDVVARTGDSMTGGTVSLSASADLPAPGDPLLVMPGRVVPEGIVGRATTVTPTGSGGATVTFAPADLGEVLADFEESYDGPLETVSGQPVVDRWVALGAAGSGGWNFSPFDGIECTGAAGTEITGVDFDMLGVGVDWGVDLSERRVHLVLTATPQLTVAMAASGGFSCSFSQELGSWPIGSLWLTPALEMGITGTFDGDLTATAAAPITIGFAYADGGRNLSSANLEGSATFHTNELGGGAVLSTGVSIAAELFGRVGVASSFGMALDARLDPAEQPCATVDLAPTVDFAVTVDLWLADWDISIAQFEGEPARLYAAHPAPPCAPSETRMWTGTIRVENRHDDDGGDYNGLSFTISPQPRPKAHVDYHGYQSARVSGTSYSGHSSDEFECGELTRASGTYEDPFVVTYPWDPDASASSPGGFFRMEVRPGSPGEPDEVDVEGVFTPTNTILGEGRDCEYPEWNPVTASIQSSFWVVEDLCMNALVQGIRDEIAASGDYETLAGTRSAELVLVPPFAPGRASCSVTWQLTSLPDPDGDGIPG